MQVRIYDVDADGNETLRCSEADLRECFPDDINEFYKAHRYLEREGRYWAGGGAAPLILLYRLADYPPVTF